ncbi:hypothetical protein [Wenzhouxiangella marina]|uniref:Uncharacterized protein n=1 Tax=Wenzhouxiangella marina TaxID=1579979 RepID=A0A0K0XX33_9GAMM|nr:hypothetical protein [Wenzhouxiangella marina]AKS42249.1 hypothetical protein WM2015_1883 [Wenzhouxiangella marina]MBB6085978.1 tetratricopeptide (TPR) repeat protein [Wenzhouxiangella marina]
MNSIESKPDSRSLFPFLGGLGVLLCATFWIYSYGLGGTWHFDDPANLDGLQQVHDWQSGLIFSVSGDSGPTGRPLSLATFAAQAEHYPENPAAFLRINIILHLVNSVLVFIAAYLLAKAAQTTTRQGLWVAFMTSAIWSLSPFLASSNLLIIQRMTSLSATFVFAGVILFLVGRTVYDDRPRLGSLLAWTAVLGATAAATLSKENGALLPCLLLLIEVFVRPESAWSHSRARKILMSALGLMAALIVGFIVAAALSSSTFEFRNYTMFERVLTQPRAIWDYLINLLLPGARAGNPFTDAYPLSRGLMEPASTVPAIAGLLLLLASIPLLARRFPLVAFGLAFFFVAHLSESTILYLEPYFAHRNYVPAFGLYLALTAGLAQIAVSTDNARIAIAGGLAYVAVLAFSLFTVTHTWGNPSNAGDQWFAQRPESPRAALFLAGAQVENDLYFSAIETLDRALRANPDDVYLLTQSLMLCDVGRDRLDEYLVNLKSRLENIERLNRNEADGLHSLALRVSRQPCPQITPLEVEGLVRLVLEDDKQFQNPASENRVLYAAAQLAAAREDYLESNVFLEESLGVEPNASTVVRIAYNLVLAGQREMAIQRLEEALNAPPDNPLARSVWVEEIKDYRDVLLRD